MRQPENNRRLLIEATLDIVAAHGISETTVSRIIERAGLSRGMIHLHFAGKNNLMAAAAEAYNTAYYEEMERQIDGHSDDPVALLWAVVRADLSPQLLNGRSVRIWHAFRGVASVNPDIARFSDTRDLRLRKMLRGAFEAIAVTEGADDALMLSREATYGTLAMLEGMWTDYLTHMNEFSRADAEKIIFRFLSGLFPGSLRR
ncbi:MAG: TetR family transcriptional regulator C-terminal domain-containing protein [Roseovarius sp.]